MPGKYGRASLTEFKRETPRFLKRLRRTKKPLVLTLNGKPELVVQEVHSYRELLARVDRLETITALHESLEDIKAGRTYPADQALDAIARKYGLLKIGEEVSE